MAISIILGNIESLLGRFLQTCNKQDNPNAIQPFDIIANGSLDFTPTFQRRYQEIKLMHFDSYGYEVGLKHGRENQEKIQMLIAQIKKDSEYPNFEEIKIRCEEIIPTRLKDEMTGIAIGAEVSYDDILLINIIPDLNHRLGCTAMATRQEADLSERKIAAANHSISEEVKDPNTLSAQRRKRLLTDKANKLDKLRSCLIDTTVQSIVFDIFASRISVSEILTKTEEDEIPTWQHFDKCILFQADDSEASTGLGTYVIRNLDWPWPFLRFNTVMHTRREKGTKKIAQVTYPGLIGSLSAMNENGLVISCCNRSGGFNERGMPNLILFTEILQKCSTVQEALKILDEIPHMSGMNLIICDRNEGFNIELTGSGCNYQIVESLSEVAAQRE